MDFSTVPEQVPEQAAQKSDNRRGNRGCIKIDNPQKKDHADPPEGAHGLVQKPGSCTGHIGSTSSGKTTSMCHQLAVNHATFEPNAPQLAATAPSWTGSTAPPGTRKPPNASAPR